MHYSIKVGKILAVILFTSSYVFSESIVEMEKVVVSAARTSRPIHLLSVSASVITRRDILLHNTKQTTEILGRLPGIFIKRTGDFGRADVDIRGLGDNGRQLGIFIDGRPDKMGLFGCSVTHTLPMNNVERIEVIRGPESVLYGSEAFGGVVNIITRRASKRLEGGLSVSGGTFGTRNYLFQQGSKLGAFDYYLSVNRLETDGHKLNSAYSATDFSGQAGYELSDVSDISFSGKYFTGLKNEPAPSPEGTWNDYKRGSGDITYKTMIADIDTSLKLYRSFGEHEFSDGFHYKDYTNGAMLHGKTYMGENNLLSAGIDYRYQFGEALNLAPQILSGRYDKYEYGIYINDDHTFFDKLTLTGGARYNYDQYAKDIINPKFGAVYIFPDDTVLRGIWSRGYRAPQLNDLYLWGGNKDLIPEKVTNSEVGVRRNFSGIADIDLAGFVMKGKDLIEMRSGRKVNIGNFTFKGIETMISFKITDSLSANGNYTYFDPEKNTSGRPMDKAGASLQYAKGRLNGIISGEYVGRYYSQDSKSARIKNYTLLNTKIDYTLIDNLSLFGAVDNAGNVKYEVYNDDLYEMPGRTFTFGVNYIFG